MTDKKYWDGEWPNLNSVSIKMDDAAFETMTPYELGISYRLIWFLAVRSVNSMYSHTYKNPSIPRDRAHIIARCSKANFKKSLSGLTGVFEKDGESLRLLISGSIQYSKDRARTTAPESVKSIMAARDGEMCVYCGDTKGLFHADHLFPFSKGGTDEPNNLVTACQSCNLSKGDKTLWEWMNGSN